MIIALTGFMGSGKSTVGKELKSKLDYSFIDLDSYIEKSSGRAIPEIFTTDGETVFRAMEQRCLTEILTETDANAHLIISLGGGTLTTPACAEMIRNSTLCFYLRAEVQTLMNNLEGTTDRRPLLQGQELKLSIITLMSERSPLYMSTAHHVIDIDGLTFPEVADRIADIVNAGNIH